MSNFIWVRNPTIINGLATTYVSKRGSDTTGNGTAQNPYASIAKATSVAASGTNIMLDDGEWDEARAVNNKIFQVWGNGNTVAINRNEGYDLFTVNTYVHFLTIKNSTLFAGNVYIYNCFLSNITYREIGSLYFYAYNSIFINTSYKAVSDRMLEATHCIFYGTGLSVTAAVTKNCILINSTTNNTLSTNNNYTNCTIPATAKNSINDSTTGQTFADYFNYYDSTDLLKCDFTAKDGSANIGAGEKCTTIGLNQGYTARADNSANDIFSAANGATVRNCSFSSSLNGYILQQVDRVCAGATSNTITFDSEASSQNGYYVGLFVGITEGVGENQIRYITDYNGATKTATVSQAWDTIPDTESEYTISGKIDSAVKDFGKAIKVKRNFTFVDNMTALANGQWAEFLTAATAQNEMQPVSCFKWEYSVDGLTWRSGTELMSATDGNNYVDNFTIGDASAQYNEAEAEFAVFRYVRFHIHIGFNIDNLAEA